MADVTKDVVNLPETTTAADSPVKVAKETTVPSKESPIVSLEPKHIMGPADEDYQRKVTYPHYSSYDPYYYSAQGWNNRQYYVNADRGYTYGCTERGCCPCLYGDP